jgi:prepilin-type N-terminal cleavage/methylation domain-containing protein
VTVPVEVDVQDESGFTLVELVVTCALLSVVLGAITTVFIAGSHAELNLNTRFRAQETARVALTLIRKDARNACVANVVSGTSVSFATAKVDQSVTPSIDPTTACGKTVGTNLTMVTWCVLASPTSINQYALYRDTSSTCTSSSKLVADNLVNNLSGFTAFFTSPTTIRYGELQSVDVDLPVKIPSSGNGVGQAYRLTQRVALRNTVWPATAGTACSGSVPCTPGACTVAAGCPYAWN